MTCAVGYGTSIYIGTSEGQIRWYTLNHHAKGTPGNGPYVLKSGQQMPMKSAIDKILLLPRVQKVAVLSDNTLYILALPSLEPLAPTIVPPIRDVTDVVLDDQEIAVRPSDTEAGGKGVEITLSIVRRKAIALYRLGSRLSHLQVRRLDEQGPLMPYD